MRCRVLVTSASALLLTAAFSAGPLAAQEAEGLRPTATPSLQAAGPQPPVAAQVVTSDGAVLPVFGANLFTGAFAASRPLQSADYLVQPGDQVAVSLYGAVNVAAVQTVDASGRLFIQGIGPVQVGGAPSTELQSRVTAAVRDVYNENVGVYVSLVQAGVMGVFVTGDVTRPGRYAGAPGDSVLYFLDQARGIDAARGSFRNIQVRREGRTVAQFDLYDFLIEGSMPPFRFEDGDVVLVGPRGAMVGVSGDVQNAAAFEAPRGAATIPAAELLRLARPLSTATSVGVATVRRGARGAESYALSAFPGASFADGDHVEIRSDLFTQEISVFIRGDLQSPRVFALPRGAKLSQLLVQVPLEGSDVVPEYVHIERRSVALAQKAALERSLSDLERAALAAAPMQGVSPQEQAAVISAFAAKVRGVTPQGKVAVYSDGEFHDLVLETGDVVVFPRRSDVVLVAGEVLAPGASTHSNKLRVSDYVARSGGFSESANRRRFVLRRADGSALVVSGGAQPRPGDEVIVVPRFSNGMQRFRDLTQIAFQVAATAAAIVNVSR